MNFNPTEQYSYFWKDSTTTILVLFPPFSVTLSNQLSIWRKGKWQNHELAHLLHQSFERFVAILFSASPWWQPPRVFSMHLTWWGLTDCLLFQAPCLRESGTQAWPALRSSFIDPHSHPEGAEAPTDISESSLPGWEMSVPYVYLKINKVNWIKERLVGDWQHHLGKKKLEKEKLLYSSPGKALGPEWFSD